MVKRIGCFATSKRIVLALAAGLALLLGLAPPSAGGQASAWNGTGRDRARLPAAIDLAGTPTWQILAPRQQDPFLPGASAVAVAGRGTTYVVLSATHSIARIGPGGKLLGQWGSDNLLDPQAIAVDHQQQVYVADDAAIGLRKYSSTGQLLGSVPAAHAQGIAVDGRGHLYLGIDTPHGAALLTLGTGLRRLGERAFQVREKISMAFSGPCGSNGVCTAERGPTHAGPIAIGPRGAIFAGLSIPFDMGKNGEYDANVIQKLSPSGRVLNEWRVDLKGEAIRGLAVGANGDIAVSDPQDHQLLIFSSSGRLRARWGKPGCGGQTFQMPLGIASAASTYLVADAGNQNVKRLSLSGVPTELIGGCPSHEFYFPWGVAVDGSGNVYVGDGYHHRIDKLGPDGTVLKRWSTGSYAAGGVDVDAQGNVYAADLHHVLKLAPDGHVAAVLGGVFNFARDVAVDGSGTIYVAEQSANRIDRLAPDGRVLARWGTKGSGSGQFDAPLGVGVDSGGNVYVADDLNNRVVKLSPSGALLATWHDFGQGRTLSGPVDVAVDRQGDVWICDSGHDRVVELSSGGTWLGSWGSGQGVGPGQLYGPTGIAVDAQGNVYVADSGNSRIQKLSFG
jgi:DNA-binding beta-propeller fold protein YncE